MVHSPRNDITQLDAVSLSAAIKARQYSCVEVMTAYLDQIERLNPQVNAIVSLRPREELLAEANNKDRQLAQGEYNGWMHGFPHAVKDLSATKGIVTTLGSPIFRSHLPQQDAWQVERIKRDGAIIIGKTNTPEFGLGSNTYNTVFGATLNAYDISKTSGGSSGGAAVALALHMLPVADGSDMMGSLRNPAAFNNVFGLRPSQGRIPFGPAPEVFASQLGCEGPMGRTVADVTQLLITQAGYHRQSPLSLTDTLPHRFQANGRQQQRLRLGWLGNLDGGFPLEEGILPLCEGGLKVFTSLGCQVEPARLNFSAEQIWQTWLICRHWQVANGLRELYQDPAKRSQMKPEALWEIEGGRQLSGEQVFNAFAARSALYRAFCSLFEQFDFLLMPSAQVFPFAAEVHSPQTIAGRTMDTYHRYMETVTAVTLAGLPALNIPVGFSHAGLPMGMQLIAPHTQDFPLLQLGQAYEQACGWRNHLPALLTA